MYDTDEARVHLITKSPDNVYYCVKLVRSLKNIKTPEYQPWYSKLKEWFFSSSQANPLPPYSHTSKKYF